MQINMTNITEKLYTFKQEAIVWIKSFVQQNKIVVISTAAFVGLVGLMNLFGTKKDTDKNKSTHNQKHLKRSSKRRYNSDGQTVQPKPPAPNFQTDNQIKQVTPPKPYRLLTEKKASQELQSDLPQNNTELRHQKLIEDSKDKLFFQMYRNLGLNKS